MGEEALAYEEIAAKQNTIFDWFRAAEIYVRVPGDESERIYGYLNTFKYGLVLDVSHSKWSSPASQWGRYVWLLDGDDAYRFCIGIRPYLVTYDIKRLNWCQRCITVHHARHRHKQAAVPQQP